MRTGCEGRVSHLKHRYDLHQTGLDGLTGARNWCGYWSGGRSKVTG